ncbi:MAG: HD domain-containing protein [Brockia lithotrophica]|nr:HD domain-containing protein [Brockia lithotrophica]
MRAIRDPLHDLIVFADEDAFLFDLVDTPAFQRLHHIRQLGLSFFVYPGAQHTRFLHSLGVAHLMRRVLDRFREDRAELRSRSPEDREAIEALLERRKVALAAALLHDVGHGPFSHALEDAVHTPHEVWSAAVVRHDAAVRDVLERAGSSPHKGGIDLPEAVARILERPHGPAAPAEEPGEVALRKLLASQLDVDRMDYLVRDAYMTGAHYGRFDLPWLIHSLRLGRVHGAIEVGLDREKGVSIAEDFFMARYYMYKHVYLHKTTRGAEILARSLFRRARDLALRGMYKGDRPLVAFLRGDLRPERPEDVATYLSLTDESVWAFVSDVRRTCRDPVLRKLAEDLWARRPMRGLDVEEDDDPTAPEVSPSKASEGGEFPRVYILFRDAFLEELRRRNPPSLSGWSEEEVREYAVAYDSTDTVPYKDTFFSPGKNGKAAGAEDLHVYVYDRRGEAKPLSEVSLLLQVLTNRPLTQRRIYVLREFSELAAEIWEKIRRKGPTSRGSKEVNS